ncbi:hypothetical protein ACHWUR_22605 [Klebsiella pneumoniae]
MPGGGLCLTRPTHPALIVCRPAQAQRRRAIAAGTEPRYAGRRLTPCPAYGAIARLFCRVAADALPGLRGPDPVCESPPNMGPLKLPGLAASTSLRRSRKAGAARMDAG